MHPPKMVFESETNLFLNRFLYSGRTSDSLARRDQHTNKLRYLRLPLCKLTIWAQRGLLKHLYKIHLLLLAMLIVS